MIRDDDAPAPQSPVRHGVGDILDALSVEELEARIGLLRREITRLEAAIVAKRASRQAADSVFKR